MSSDPHLRKIESFPSTAAAKRWVAMMKAANKRHPDEAQFIHEDPNAKTKPATHRSKGKHRAGGRTAKEQALRNVEAASIRHMHGDTYTRSISPPGYERALAAAWKAGATDTEIQQAMRRGEARVARHRAKGRHR